MATSKNLQLAAQAWCTPKTERTVMNPDLAEAFADILDKQNAYMWGHDFALDI